MIYALFEQKEEEKPLFYIIFYIIVIPLSFLLHEIGHGIGVVLTSKSQAHIYLGSKNEQNKINFRLGRFCFHLQLAYMGFCGWEDGLNKRQKFFSLISGPLTTLLLMVMFLFLRDHVGDGDVRTLFVKAAEFNLILFLSTIIPFRYPCWMGTMAGYPTDGLQLIGLFQNEIETEE